MGHTERETEGDRDRERKHKCARKASTRFGSHLRRTEDRVRSERRGLFASYFVFDLVRPRRKRAQL